MPQSLVLIKLSRLDIMLVKVLQELDSSYLSSSVSIIEPMRNKNVYVCINRTVLDSLN